MRAARVFIGDLGATGSLDPVERVVVDLYGSLAATGIGHGTDRAIIAGLEGEDPSTVVPRAVACRYERAVASGVIRLGGAHTIESSVPNDLNFDPSTMLPGHPNVMRLRAFGRSGRSIVSTTYFSVGGGFIVPAGTGRITQVTRATAREVPNVPLPFESAKELLERCRQLCGSISDVMLMNEEAWRPRDSTAERLLVVWKVMQDCVTSGLSTPERLPGSLAVRRRAPEIHAKLVARDPRDDLDAIDRINVFAIAVNGENAAGGRVVTAPINGAAGITPAVLHYYVKFFRRVTDDHVIRFLLTAAAIGILLKTKASISGAEVGCQGEVGSACAMAAAGLCEILGGTPGQVENAAEMALERHLGMTCDPIGGLVQIPCIERNAIAAVKAVNSARLALLGDGPHVVSLDVAIATMLATGRDMGTQYKETSTGGLAVNVTEC